MADKVTDLLPSLPVIRDRLTENQRERQILQTLFKLAVHNTERQKDAKARPPTSKKGGVT
jgi:hypothetical protein